MPPKHTEELEGQGEPTLLHTEAFPDTVYCLESFFLLGFYITERLSVSCSYRDHNKIAGEQVVM